MVTKVTAEEVEDLDTVQYNSSHKSRESKNNNHNNRWTFLTLLFQKSTSGCTQFSEGGDLKSYAEHL